MEGDGKGGGWGERVGGGWGGGCVGWGVGGCVVRSAFLSFCSMPPTDVLWRPDIDLNVAFLCGIPPFGKSAI